MERTLFSAEHDEYRRSFKQFAAREITPHQQRWR